MKNKIVKSNIKKVKDTKIYSILESGLDRSEYEYESLFTGQMNMTKPEYIDAYFVEFSNAANKDKDILFLEDFLNKKDICRWTWQSWIEKCPDRKQRHQEGMEAIGRNRERGAMKKEYSEKTVHFMQSHYSSGWRQQREEASKLGIHEDQQKPITVILEGFEKKVKE